MRNWFYRDADAAASVGLLLLRITMGAAFILHGWSKMMNENGPTRWMGDALPGPLQLMAVIAEVGGGAALILGLLTPVAALLLAGTMAYAAGMVHIRAGDPFVNPGGKSWELAAVYLACSILFLLIGPGRISLAHCCSVVEPIGRWIAIARRRHVDVAT